MRRNLFFALVATALLTSCDDGPIEEKSYASSEGKNVKLEGVITGVDEWPDGFSVNLAGFVPDDDSYATIAKIVPSEQTGDYHVSMYLKAIPMEVTSVRLCLLNNLRQHIATFAEVDISDASSRDTVYFHVDTISAGMFTAIQKSYLTTTCAACHGATGRAAAGLFLTEDKSYEALVGQPSKKVEGQMIVKPGSAEESVLYQALTTELTQDWREYHRDLVSEYYEQNILPIIRSWIDNGAQR
ncbi:MAG: hypothetical protein K6C30_05495 [Bacteroidaceae bacterium]|nr:hypothetical protein [Bacteroidaceae bacterium]